jgi:hypothetical protein
MLSADDRISIDLAMIGPLPSFRTTEVATVLGAIRHIP